ncbi:hypothetical protein [Ruegeria sp. SCP11]|uniref:hypothetical protein n=1 Tax=Ruegeria sp. SCP11 TaxID=3141378 RepID=UPI00333CA5F0
MTTLLPAVWGSGKTHFIERASNCKADKTRLYMSLYNVHSAEEFDWALVRAENPWTESTARNLGGRAKEAFS